MSGAEVLGILADAQELRKRAKDLEMHPGESEEWGAIYHHAEAHKNDKPVSILRVQIADREARAGRQRRIEMKASQIPDPRRLGPGELRLVDELQKRFGSKLTTADILFAVSFREAFRRGVIPAKPKEKDLPPTTWQRIRTILAKAPDLAAGARHTASLFADVCKTQRSR